MRNKLKITIGAIGFVLASASSVTSAKLTLPNPTDACVLEGMATYCKKTGQGSSCPVPTNVYWDIVRNCT